MKNQIGLLKNLKEVNKKKQYKLNKLKLQLLKEENKKKEDKLNKMSLNLLLKKNKPKTKPKKSIWDVIKYPEPNFI